MDGMNSRSLDAVLRTQYPPTGSPLTGETCVIRGITHVWAKKEKNKNGKASERKKNPPQVLWCPIPDPHNFHHETMSWRGGQGGRGRDPPRLDGPRLQAHRSGTLLGTGCRGFVHLHISLRKEINQAKETTRKKMAQGREKKGVRSPLPGGTGDEIA